MAFEFDFLKFQELVYRFAPLLLMSIPGGERIVPYVPQIIELIRQAEQLPLATGAQKKEFVLDALRTSIEINNKIGDVVVDANTVVLIAGVGIDIIITVVNLLGRQRVVPVR